MNKAEARKANAEFISNACSAECCVLGLAHGDIHKAKGVG